MADSKLTALTAASALDGTELLYGSQGGASRKITTAQMQTLARTYRGVIASLAATESAADYSGTKIIPFDTMIDNQGGFTLSSGLVTIPAGVTRVRATLRISTFSVTGSLAMTARINKNGAVLTPGCGAVFFAAYGSPIFTLPSYPISVVAGDTISATLNVSDTSISVFTDTTLDVVAM